MKEALGKLEENKISHWANPTTTESSASQLQETKSLL